MIVTIQLPHSYSQYIHNEKMFKRYAIGFIHNNMPEWDPVKGQAPSLYVKCTRTEYVRNYKNKK